MGKIPMPPLWNHMFLNFDAMPPPLRGDQASAGLAAGGNGAAGHGAAGTVPGGYGTSIEARFHRARHLVPAKAGTVPGGTGNGAGQLPGTGYGACNCRHGIWCRLRPARYPVVPCRPAQSFVPHFLAVSVASVSLRRGFGKGGAVPRREARSRAFFWRHAPPARIVPPIGGTALVGGNGAAYWRTVLAGRQTGADRNWGFPGRDAEFGNADVLEHAEPGGSAEPGNAEFGRNAGSGDCPPARLGRRERCRQTWCRQSAARFLAARYGAGQLPGTEYGAAYWRHGSGGGRQSRRPIGRRQRGGGRVWQDAGASRCRGARASRCRDARASRCAAVLRDGRCRPAGMVPPGYGAAYWRRGSWRHGVAGRMRAGRYGACNWRRGFGPTRRGAGLHGACNWRRGFGPARFPGGAVPGTVRGRERGHVKKQSVGLDGSGGRRGCYWGRYWGRPLGSGAWKNGVWWNGVWGCGVGVRGTAFGERGRGNGVWGCGVWERKAGAEAGYPSKDAGKLKRDGAARKQGMQGAGAAKGDAGEMLQEGKLRS